MKITLPELPPMTYEEREAFKKYTGYWASLELAYLKTQNLTLRYHGSEPYIERV
jgi:hypothetical protein